MKQLWAPNVNRFHSVAVNTMNLVDKASEHIEIVVIDISYHILRQFLVGVFAFLYDFDVEQASCDSCMFVHVFQFVVIRLNLFWCKQQIDGKIVEIQQSFLIAYCNHSRYSLVVN